MRSALSKTTTSFPKPDRIVIDSIHGAIELSQLERKVIDTATFQRLRHLKQLGFGHVTYPNATHTRFAHSLGVLAIMSRVVSVTAERLKLNEMSQQDLRLAALLHDVGHYPYSHLMERLDDVVLLEDRVRSAKKATARAPDPYPDHERLGRIIVTEQGDLVEAIGGPARARRIADLFTRDPAADAQLSKLIHSSLDMDRLDYLMRDARAAGVPYGHIDLPYLMHNLDASSSGMIGIKHKALSAAEQFLLARYFMHKTVYFHKTTFALEEACRQLLRRCRDAGKYQVPGTGSAVELIARNPKKLLEFTDHFVDGVARKAIDDRDTVISSLARAIVYRKPPKLLGEAAALIDTTRDDAKRHNAVAAFVNSCQERIEKLAADCGLQMGRFLLAELRPIQLEKRGPLIPADDAKEQPGEKEDELIKVFVRGKPEPKSLVDIPESFISLCANHAAKAARLYVIEEDRKKVERMRAIVGEWL